MKVALRIDRSLEDRLEALHFSDRYRILEETVTLVTRDLENGSRRRTARVVTDVDDETAGAYERAIYQNRSMRTIVVDRILRTVLAREELRPK